MYNNERAPVYEGPLTRECFQYLKFYKDTFDMKKAASWVTLQIQLDGPVSDIQKDFITLLYQYEYTSFELSDGLAWTMK